MGVAVVTYKFTGFLAGVVDALNVATAEIVPSEELRRGWFA